MSVSTAVEPIQSRAIGTLEDLVLIRLLPPSKSPVAPSVVMKTLEKFLGDSIEKDQFSQLISDLRSQGLIEPKGLRLTEAGRAKALGFLGIAELPPKSNWGSIQAKYLVPKVLGLKPGSESTQKALKDRKNFAALLLKRKLELPIGTGSTLNNVMEAIVCQELGFPDITTLKALRERVLHEKLNTKEKLSAKELELQLPRVLLETTGGMTGLRASVLNGAFSLPDLKEESDSEAEPIYVETFDLTVFANTVNAAARECRTGRFGESKVFINHVWNSLKDEPMLRGFDLTRFKEKLIEANRDHLLTLTRADMAAHLNQRDVLESECHYFNSEFHFIHLEKEQA